MVTFQIDYESIIRSTFSSDFIIWFHVRRQLNIFKVQHDVLLTLAQSIQHIQPSSINMIYPITQKHNNNSRWSLWAGCRPWPHVRVRKLWVITRAHPWLTAWLAVMTPVSCGDPHLTGWLPGWLSWLLYHVVTHPWLAVRTPVSCDDPPLADCLAGYLAGCHDSCIMWWSTPGWLPGWLSWLLYHVVTQTWLVDCLAGCHDSCVMWWPKPDWLTAWLAVMTPVSCSDPHLTGWLPGWLPLTVIGPVLAKQT